MVGLKSLVYVLYIYYCYLYYGLQSCFNLSAVVILYPNVYQMQLQP